MSLQVILGCMFSGKTTEMLRVIRRHRALNQRVMIINYSLDTRYSTTEEHRMLTHDREGEIAIPLDNLEPSQVTNISEYQESDVIAINEGQFFPNLVQFCQQALKDNKKIIVGGLDGDYRQRPFGEILNLIPIADTVTRLNAFCVVCRDGTPAYFTKRIVESTDQLLIGGSESYQPVCREHL